MNIGTFFRGVLCPFDSGSRFLLYLGLFHSGLRNTEGCCLSLVSETRNIIPHGCTLALQREIGEVLCITKTRSQAETLLSATLRSHRRRYYSTGPIQSMDNLPDEKNYRFHLWAYGNGGQSGGMTYYKPTSDYKSTLGILTGGVGIDSYGMKLNTTLLRFYLQNTNL